VHVEHDALSVRVGRRQIAQEKAQSVEWIWDAEMLFAGIEFHAPILGASRGVSNRNSSAWSEAIDAVTAELPSRHPRAWHEDPRVCFRR